MDLKAGRAVLCAPRMQEDIRLLPNGTREATRPTRHRFSSPAPANHPLAQTESRAFANFEEGLMSDLIYIGLIVVFFIVSSLYTRFCEKL